MHRRAGWIALGNVVAMAGPVAGRGDYTERQIEYVLATAFTAFAAVRQEVVEDAEAVIHTGFWGCGAFGGNRTLMIALQVVAARAAQVSRLVIHAGDAAGVEDAQWGLDVADSLASHCAPTCPPEMVVGVAAMLGYRWGVSDGKLTCSGWPPSFDNEIPKMSWTIRVEGE